MATVVLDPGHGGSDPGAVNGARRESDDNLRMALAVGNLLRCCGVNVVFTRTGDTLVSLAERSRISNNARANLFVSIHRNSVANATANGVENWVYLNPSTQGVNSAYQVLNRIVAAGVQSNRGVRRGNFSVLRETQAPAQLVELGFISNAEDNRLFDARFDAYAHAIASGILASLGIRCQGVNTGTAAVSPPPPPPVTPPVPPPGSGASAATIRRIQQTLNERYGAGLSVDGIWGPLSRRALVRAYQIELNSMFNADLNTDGVFGPLTRAATRLVRQGDRGNLVWILQAALYTNGFPANPDGIFGPLTAAQVRAFQSSRGLNPDGIAGPNTFERLFT